MEDNSIIVQALEKFRVKDDKNIDVKNFICAKKIQG